jgi:hypothetical protein
MVINESITIQADLQKVWKTFTDLTCWNNWNTVMQDVKSDEHCLTKSKYLKCCFRPFVFPIKVNIEIEEIVPYKRVIWSAKKRGLSAYHKFLFEKNERGTIVTSNETFDGFLPKTSAFLFPKSKMRNLTKIFLRDLKKAAELE